MQIFWHFYISCSPVSSCSCIFHHVRLILKKKKKIIWGHPINCRVASFRTWWKTFPIFTKLYLCNVRTCMLVSTLLHIWNLQFYYHDTLIALNSNFLIFHRNLWMSGIIKVLLKYWPHPILVLCWDKFQYFIKSTTFKKWFGRIHLACSITGIYKFLVCSLV